jgi:TonB family protein
MKTLVVALALSFSVGGHTDPRPRVAGWNPAPSSGWKFESGSTPKYPQEAVRQRLEGDVLLNVRISPGGRIDNVESARGEPLLVNAVRQSVSSWKFVPAERGATPSTAHVPVGIQFRLDLDLADLLERADGLTVTRRGAGDSIRATAEVASGADRAKIARALTAGGFLSKTGRGTADPKGADWGMQWRTQGRAIEMRFAEKAEKIVVTDEGRKWAGSNGKKARTLADELHAVLP